MLDANAVFGKPIISASGTQFIPFSKITIGNLAGGGEYGDQKTVKQAQRIPFAGGNGAVVTMKPLGFLIDDSPEYCSVEYSAVRCLRRGDQKTIIRIDGHE